MCGIAGIIKFDSTEVKRTAIDGMLSKIKHRGPDDEAVFLDGNTGFGFVRLSIIDLSPAGNQPMHSADGRYVMVFNGEIYNYIELREELEKEGLIFKTKTDSEVLLNAYIKWGEACLDKFNGMWAFAIYDRETRKIFAARDRFGIKPFYYYHTPGEFVFCSEIPPLLPFMNGKPKPDYNIIFNFLVFNRTDQNENTFFESVKKLQHGHCLRIENNTVKIERWYNLKEKVKKEKGFKSATEFRACLEDSIKLRLRSDVPVGVCLSGGIDSASIVSVLAKTFQLKDLSTFSAVYKKGEYGDETEFINEYKDLVQNMYYISPSAETLEADLKDFVCTHAEPIPSTSPYAQYKVMQLAKGKVVVTIDGQGADEHLAGYHYFFGFYFKDLFLHFKWFTLIKEICCYLKIHKSLYGIKTFAYFLLPLKLKTRSRVNENKFLKDKFVQERSGSNSIAKTIYASESLEKALIDHFEYKLEHLLKWEDRNSMRFSLEARVPFLDYRLVEKSLATVADQKIRGGTTKFILKEAMKDIVPEKIRARMDKVGFGTPQNNWFRKPEWQKMINAILNSKSFSERNIIEAETAKKLYQKHLKGDINIAKEIWKWIHLELWFREFID